jgi:uncharacterized damage-inducible protein DinB
MLQTVKAFADYYEGIRRRTMTFIRTVPADKVEWSPGAGEFSFGVIIRHLTAAEPMFVGAVVDGRWVYGGHEAKSEPSLDALIADMTIAHEEAMRRLRAYPDSELFSERPTLNGTPVKAWRLMMAMVEHEIHHRSQLAMYLTLNGVKPPHIYGLGVEDVIALATG